VTQSIGFRFPYDQSDQWDGFNDSGIEHFSGDPYVHLGREVVQNTLDARPEGTSAPAHIMIQVIEIPTSSIPDLATLRRTLAACRLAADNESEKAQIFFENALELLSKSKIAVLKISDYNTTGVRGPCENGTPYFALLKASGQSKKNQTTAAGSYGIGKYAPFAVSALRTVFVTTIWEGNGVYHQYVQGKSILMSHKENNGKTREGIGFWGIKERCLPVEPTNECVVPDWLLRGKSNRDLSRNVGTTLSILAFPAQRGWERILAASIAENFFAAINRAQLDVVIQGELIINNDNIEQLFSNPEIRQAIEHMKGQPEHFDEVCFYLEALAKSDNVIVEQTENLHLGNCELRILLGDNLPKRVAILRHGMLITEETEGLRKFGDFKEFVAVLECKSTKGNELLRPMEPPRHDDFEPDRLPTEKDKSKGRLALRELSKWVRDMLRRHAQNPVSEVTSIDELREYFADEGEGGTDNRTGEEDPGGRLSIRARPLRPKKNSAPYQVANGADEYEAEISGDDTDGEYPTGTGGTGGGSSATDRELHGNNSNTSNAPSRVNLANVRAVPLTDTRRKIAFTPDYSGDLVVTLEDSGADRNYRLGIVSADLGKVKSGRLEGIKVTAGNRYVFEVELDRQFRGAIKVTANAI
jgi:hypothetical protein